jgi:hypothetical protein
MELFVLMDAAFFGRGIFGIFTNGDLALKCRDNMKGTFCRWEIRKVSLIGENPIEGLVYAAYIYHELYDCYTFDGLYAREEYAKDAVGDKGMVVEFRIDAPYHKRLIVKGSN